MRDALLRVLGARSLRLRTRGEPLQEGVQRHLMRMAAREILRLRAARVAMALVPAAPAPARGPCAVDHRLKT